MEICSCLLLPMAVAWTFPEEALNVPVELDPSPFRFEHILFDLREAEVVFTVATLIPRASITGWASDQYEIHPGEYIAGAPFDEEFLNLFLHTGEYTASARISELDENDRLVIGLYEDFWGNSLPGLTADGKDWALSFVVTAPQDTSWTSVIGTRIPDDSEILTALGSSHRGSIYVAMRTLEMQGFGIPGIELEQPYSSVRPALLSLIDRVRFLPPDSIAMLDKLFRNQLEMYSPARWEPAEGWEF